MTDSAAIHARLRALLAALPSGPRDADRDAILDLARAVADLHERVKALEGERRIPSVRATLAKHGIEVTPNPDEVERAMRGSTVYSEVAPPSAAVAAAEYALVDGQLVLRKPTESAAVAVPREAIKELLTAYDDPRLGPLTAKGRDALQAVSAWLRNGPPPAPPEGAVSSEQLFHANRNLDEILTDMSTDHPFIASLIRGHLHTLRAALGLEPLT